MSIPSGSIEIITPEKACKPGPVTWGMPRETVISLGRRLPGASSGFTREPTRAALHPVVRPGLLSYLALLRVGFTEPAWSPAPLVSSYLTVSPLPPRFRDGGLLSVALVRGVAPPGR